MLIYDINERHILVSKKLAQLIEPLSHQVKVYDQHLVALYDVISSLQNFLPHKSYYAVCKKGTSTAESLASLWLRNSNQVQFKQDQQGWVEYIETLHAETNFVVWASENEVTGEIIVDKALAEEIHQRLSKKRVFSVQITHQIDSINHTSPFSVVVLRPSVFKDESTFVFLAEKFKAVLPLAVFQNYQNERMEKLVDELGAKLKTAKIETSHSIIKIEDALREHQFLYFERFVETTPRLADRLVLSFSNLQGHQLAQNLGLSSSQFIAPSAYPFWIVENWKNWWVEAQSEIFLRGLLVIHDSALISSEHFTANLLSVSKKIMQDSSWVAN